MYTPIPDFKNSFATEFVKSALYLFCHETWGSRADILAVNTIVKNNICDNTAYTKPKIMVY